MTHQNLDLMFRYSSAAILAMYLLFCTSCVSPQANLFRINGEIQGIPDSTHIMLLNLRTGEVVDSCYAESNKFDFSGELKNEPEELRIISAEEEMKKGNFFYTDLLMGNENVTLHAHLKDLPHNISTSGSATQSEAERYRQGLYGWQSKIESIKKRISTLAKNDSLSRQKLEDSLRINMSKKIQWEDQYLIDNFNSYIGLLMHIYRRSIDHENLKLLFESCSSTLKESIYGRAIRAQIDFPKPLTGDRYYDFDGSDLNGGVFKLSDISDKFILLQFAGTRCYGSNLAVDDMEKSYSSYRDSIEFVSVFHEPDQEACFQYVEDRDLPWRSVWVEGAKYGVVPNKYGVVGTPTFFLISPNKEVVSTWFGFDEGMIQKEITEAMSNSSFQGDDSSVCK